MTSRDIETRHARTYKFRPRGAQETRGRYRELLIQHVKKYDMAAAFEVQLGRVQADWTPEEVTAFRALLDDERATPRYTNPPPLVETILAGTMPIDEAFDTNILEMGRQGLAGLMQMRVDNPAREMPILLSMVLANGEVHVAPSGRGDRYAILKAFAQQFQMVGFTVGADTFMHMIDHGVATKRDAIIMHVGTHNARWVLTRPYTVENGVATFDDPPPPDIDGRNLPAGAQVTDPYAEILCSVPLPTGPPS